MSRIIGMDVEIDVFKPVRGSSYIELPQQVKEKEAVINVKNNDNRCFICAILSALHPPERNSQRTLEYKEHTKELNFDGIQLSVTIEDIPRFAKNNDIKVNLFGYDKVIKLIWFTGDKNAIDLLLISGQID